MWLGRLDLHWLPGAVVPMDVFLPPLHLGRTAKREASRDGGFLLYYNLPSHHHVQSSLDSCFVAWDVAYKAQQISEMTPAVATAQRIALRCR